MFILTTIVVVVFILGLGLWLYSEELEHRELMKECDERQECINRRIREPLEIEEKYNKLQSKWWFKYI